MIPSWNPPFTYLLISGKPRISDDQIVTSVTFSHSIPWYPEHIAPWYPTLGLQNKNRRIGRWSKSQVFRNSLWQFKWNQTTWQLLGLNFSGDVGEDIYIYYIYIYTHTKAQYIQHVYHIYSVYVCLYIYGNTYVISKKSYFGDIFLTANFAVAKRGWEFAMKSARGDLHTGHDEGNNVSIWLAGQMFHWYHMNLVGGLEHVLFFHRLGRTIPID